MKKEISERIQILGGDYFFTGESLLKDINSIHFKKNYLMVGFEDLLDDEEYDKLEHGGELLYSEIDYPLITFLARKFTPFKEGTDDFEEFHDLLNKQKIKKIIPDDHLNFLIVGETDSYPNFYFISLADKNPQNPTVYSTDHEVYFDEIEIVGTFEDYLKLFVSETDYLKTIEALKLELQNESSDN